MARWYAVALLIEVVLPDPRPSDEPPDDDQTFEKNVVVIRAADEEAARALGRQHCQGNLVEYSNSFGGRVEWRCRGILSVTDLYARRLTTGTEVYSELLSREEADALLARAGDSFEPVSGAGTEP